jgi:hypothetical protein
LWVSSTAKIADVSGERIVPPHDRRHADERPQAWIADGDEPAEHGAYRSTHHQQGSEHAARGSGPQRDRPDDRLDDHEADCRVVGHLLAQQRADVVVADAESARIDKAADADGEAADSRPPHPVNRQALEQVLAGVDHLRQEPGGEAADDAEACGEQQAGRDQRGAVRHREQRAGAEQDRPPPGSDHAGDGDRHEAARLPFEKQQLDRQQHGRDRRAERRRHARRRAGHEQRLAFGVREMKELREKRAERTAGHDDRPFRAERAAGADRDRRRQRLQDGDARLDAALADQDRLHRLGDPVAADLLRAEARHEADQKAPDHGDEHRPQAQRVPGDRHLLGTEPAVVAKVRHQIDQSQQQPGGAGAGGPDDDRHCGEQNQSFVGREIAQSVVRPIMMVGAERTGIGSDGCWRVHGRQPRTG